MPEGVAPKLGRLTRRMRDITRATSRHKRGQRGAKTATELRGLRTGNGEWEGRRERWPQSVHAHFACNFTSDEAILAQRERIATWESIAACQRRDGAGSSPAESFDDDVEATHRLRLRKARGRDDVPAELLATWDSVAAAQVYSLSCARIAAREGLTSVIECLGNWNLYSIPKFRRNLENLANWRPLC